MVVPTLYDLAQEGLTRAFELRCLYLLNDVCESPVPIPTPIEHNRCLMRVLGRRKRDETVASRMNTEDEMHAQTDAQKQHRAQTRRTLGFGRSKPASLTSSYF